MIVLPFQTVINRNIFVNNIEPGELMIALKELTLADKPEFDRLLAGLQAEISDLTFTNLFMWQYSYGIHAFYEAALDYWILLAKPSNWPPFFLPAVGDWSDSLKLTQALKKMDDLARTENFDLVLRRVPRRLAEALQRIDSSLIYHEDRNTFDYLYRSQDLIELAGRRYHSKRNFLSRFQRQYNWEYQQITPENVRECLELKTEWFNLKRIDQDLTSEEQAMALVLDNFERLGVGGGLIKVDGIIQAIAVGEKLTENTAVIHIEKANTEFEGIYAAINQLFANNQWRDLEFINREEDMGFEGLRKAKLSYHPVKLIEKYSVSRNR
jgi:uncharacterized protein